MKEIKLSDLDDDAEIYVQSTSDPLTGFRKMTKSSYIEYVSWIRERGFKEADINNKMVVIKVNIK